MSIIILYILVFFIMYLCYLNLYVRENLVADDEWRKYFKKCDGDNCELKPVVSNIDCKGGWLPWSLPDFSSLNNNSKKAALLACTEKDYESALHDHIPEGWYNAVRRMN